jgi:hypothetical protein
MKPLTYEEASEILSYCPETGHVSWLKPTANAVRAGQRAGAVGDKGYRFIMVCGGRYREHRIAWLLSTGSNAPHEVDHINGDPADNRLANLRLATHAENMQNTRSSRKRTRPGLVGASFFKPAGKWRARIMASGETHNLGYFDSEEEAHSAYVAAKARLHTFQPHLREAA